MSLTEKLDIINREIQLFHEFCKDKGYKDFEIETIAEPILKVVKDAKRNRWLHRLKWMVIFVIGFIALTYCNQTYKLLCMVGRLTTVKLILPYWDWTKYYDSDCLVANPYYVGKQLSMDDCELCEASILILREEKISQEIISEDYLQRDVPVIVTDAMNNWPHANNITMQFLKEFHQNDKYLAESRPCMFASNLKVSRAHYRTVLRKAASGNIHNYYAHWENCDVLPAKSLRKLYKRPYFMPAMVEFRASNWLFISSGYRGAHYKPSPIDTRRNLGLIMFDMPMGWIAMLQGQMDIRLVPRPPCNATCLDLVDTLYQGEILLYTDYLWSLEYLPSGPGDNIAIGAGAGFDVPMRI